MTSRGMKEKEFEQIAEFLDRGIQVAINAKKYSSKYESIRIIK
jgi:glycine/serine hydroxymethyltransferase